MASPMAQPLDPPFLGETLSLQHVNGVTLSENVYERRSRVPRHTHESSFFSLTLSGGYVETHSARDLDYAVGSVSFHPPWDEHSLRIKDVDTRCLNVELGREWSIDSDLVRLENGPLLWLAARLYSAFRSPFSDAMAIENLVLEMLGSVAERGAERPNAREPRWLVAVDEMIRAEFSTSVTVFDLARRVGVHPVHLSRTWRRFRECSIPRYLHRLRVDAACRMMSEQDVSLADLALEVGFADQPHFCHVFKTVTGTTPGQFHRMFEIHKNRQRPIGIV